MKKRIIPILLAGLFFAGTSLFAQTQADRDAAKRDLYVILDVSGSMKDENRFTNVQDYLEREVIDGLLKNGDDFTLVTFGEGAEQQFTRTISTAADRTSLKTDLHKLRPNDNYTDIGSALEKLAGILEKRETADTRRVILFITDGLNVPPPGSKYYGVDITTDSRFKTLGERISKGSWFLYVIGIGGTTAARDVANLIPGSELLTTDSDLSGMDVTSRVKQQEDEDLAKAAAKAEEEQKLAEERRLEEERNAGLMGFLRRMADALGISVPMLIGGFFLILLLLILLLVFLLRAFRTRELVITDEKETIIRKIQPFGGITLNSQAAILPSIGNENNQAIRIERGLLNFSVKTIDSEAIAENSPYKKNGIHPLKGVVSLAKGGLIRITVR